jgi:hypothetical protein
MINGQSSRFGRNLFLPVVLGHPFSESDGRFQFRFNPSPERLASLRTALNPRVSPTLRLAVVGAALERFLQGRPLDHFAIVFRTFVHFGTEALGDGEFLAYLQAWLRGHFIVLPPDR